MDMEELAARLCKLRDERGLTIPDIARKSGLSESTVWRLFNGKAASPNLQTLLDVLKAMDCTLADLRDDGAPGGESPKAEPTSPSSEKSAMDTVDLEQLIAPYQQHIEDLQQSRKKLFIACCVLVSFVLAILLIDLCNPAIGFLRT